MPFAEKAWPMLRIGGHLLFHDTCRPQDVSNVLNLLQQVFLEAVVVACNEQTSNITSIRKKIREPYVNWNWVEGRMSGS